MFNNLSQQAKALSNEDPTVVYGALYTFLDSKEDPVFPDFSVEQQPSCTANSLRMRSIVLLFLEKFI